MSIAARNEQGAASTEPNIRVDAIESALVATGVVADQSAVGTAGYGVANRLAETCLRAGLDVVIDAVNPVEVARAPGDRQPR